MILYVLMLELLLPMYKMYHNLDYGVILINYIAYKLSYNICTSNELRSDFRVKNGQNIRLRKSLAHIKNIPQSI